MRESPRSSRRRSSSGWERSRAMPEKAAPAQDWPAAAAPVCSDPDLSDGEDYNWTAPAASCARCWQQPKNSMPTSSLPQIMKPMCSMKWEQGIFFLYTFLSIFIDDLYITHFYRCRVTEMSSPPPCASAHARWAQGQGYGILHHGSHDTCCTPGSSRATGGNEVSRFTLVSSTLPLITVHHDLIQ